VVDAVCVVAGFAVIALVAAQLMLSAAIHGMNYSGGDAWSRLGVANAFNCPVYREYGEATDCNAHNIGELCGALRLLWP
jgi:hypothetical protein